MNATHLNDESNPAKRSDMLNVLTILTFVGCAFALFSAFTGYTGAAERYQQLLQNQDKVATTNAPAVLKVMTGPGMVEMARKTLVNRVPILILELIGIALCAGGAFLMRSLKKAGFWIYLVGELLPTITSLALVGTNVFAGIFIVIGLIISLVFIALYATQVKFMS